MSATFFKIQNVYTVSFTMRLHGSMDSINLGFYQIHRATL